MELDVGQANDYFLEGLGSESDELLEHIDFDENQSRFSFRYIDTSELHEAFSNIRSNA